MLLASWTPWRSIVSMVRPQSHVFWISSKCFTSSHNYENFANLKRTIWKHVIKHGQEIRPFLKDLIPCHHFSKFFKNLEILGGVKLKHLLEIQNIVKKSPLACTGTHCYYWFSNLCTARVPVHTLTMPTFTTTNHKAPWSQRRSCTGLGCRGFRSLTRLHA